MASLIERRDRGRHLVFLVGLASFVAFGLTITRHAASWLDEGNYLMRSWWYAQGIFQPYSPSDATWYLPLYFYVLGFAQSAFSPGFATGRLLSLALALAATAICAHIARRLFDDALAGAFVWLLVGTTLSSVYYFSTATPYAFVAFLSMVLLWAILSQGKRRTWLPISVVIGVLYASLFFTRSNMVLGIPIFAAMQAVAAPDRRMLRLAASAAGALLVFALVVAVFGQGILVWIVYLPIVHEVLLAFLPVDDTLSRVLASTSGIYKESWSPSLISFRQLRERFFLPYAALLVGLVLFLMQRRLVARRHLLDLCVGYFAVMAILHYLAALEYCDGCIRPYTNYFLHVAAIPAAGGFAMALRRLPARLFGIGAVGAVLGIVALNTAVSIAIEFPLARLAPFRSQGYFEAVDAARKMVLENTRAEERVLVISRRPIPAQAVFLAGRVPVLWSINYSYSHRVIANHIPPERHDDLLKEIERLNLWTDRTMQNAIACGAPAILLDDEEKARWVDLVEARFEPGPIVPLGKHKLTFYRRTTRDSSCATVGPDGLLSHAAFER